MRLTFLHLLLLLEHLASLGHDIGVTFFTEAEHGHPGLGCFHDQTKSLWMTHEGSQAGRYINSLQIIIIILVKTPELCFINGDTVS